MQFCSAQIGKGVCFWKYFVVANSANLLDCSEAVDWIGLFMCVCQYQTVAEAFREANLAAYAGKPINF